VHNNADIGQGREFALNNRLYDVAPVQPAEAAAERRPWL
jgi:hypothetical protein